MRINDIVEMDISEFDFISSLFNKKIKKIEIVENVLYIHIHGDSRCLKIWDDGEICCNHREMETSDDFDYYKDSSFIKIEDRTAVAQAGYYVGVFNIKKYQSCPCFFQSKADLLTPNELFERGHEHWYTHFKIHTDKGVITIYNHNRFNLLTMGFKLKVSVCYTN